ncbi:MAG TPA: hypothetical protein DD670_13095 [Planctomycetaceae bacterium]|nr:hypothetical protein [Planctomycetaceae bacterium]
MNLGIHRPASFRTARWERCVFCGLVLLLVSGCTGFRGPGLGWPSSSGGNKRPELETAAVSIKSPHERMVEYREMGKRGPSYAPEEQQRIAGQLAGEFRTENDPLIRAQMVRTLSKLRADEADSVLREAMEDSSLEVRIAACQVWGDRKSPEAVELLGRRIASDTNTDVRLAAARALGETRDQAAVAKLGVALDDSDPALQRRAVMSLQRLTGENLGNDVNRWRQYVNGEPIVPAEPISIAERLRQMF